MKHINCTILLLCCLVNASTQPPKRIESKTQPSVTTANTGGTKMKYTVELEELYTHNAYDGTYYDGLTKKKDYTEEIYGAISVCLAASGHPPPIQLDYTYKNPIDKEITGGVEPSPQSTNPNGRVLWRQSDAKGDRRIHLNSSTRVNNKFPVGSKAVFIFDTKTDPQAAFRLFADMWESDDSDDDEHFNASSARRLSVPIAEIKAGAPAKTYSLYIWDSSSRHFAKIKISAEAIQ